MNIITEPATMENIKTRIQKLDENSVRQWGKMNVDQMLSHCIDGLRMIIGELKTDKKAPKLIQFLLKTFVINGKQFPKNSPTAAELNRHKTPGFQSKNIAEAKQTLLTYIDKLKNASDDQFGEHPAFGKMSKTEYGVLVYKHLDHHLRQFGV
ncbi:MAG: DUF1569 domain-containing protein [Chitinophagaceae bacterium]|nr:MAG: DUF1569 domain-containing protein [Chitinophagaceae bacterium]